MVISFYQAVIDALECFTFCRFIFLVPCPEQVSSLALSVWPQKSWRIQETVMWGYWFASIPISVLLICWIFSVDCVPFCLTSWRFFIANNSYFPEKNLSHLRYNLFYLGIISLFTHISREEMSFLFFKEQPSPDVSTIIPLHLSFPIIVQYHSFFSLSLSLSSLYTCLCIPFPGLPKYSALCCAIQGGQSGSWACCATVFLLFKPRSLV